MLLWNIDILDLRLFHNFFFKINQLPVIIVLVVYHLLNLSFLILHFGAFLRCWQFLGRFSFLLNLFRSLSYDLRLSFYLMTNFSN